jgi:hypothetical protein
MSKAIEAFEELERNNMVFFSGLREVYRFWTRCPSPISKKRYENLEKRLERDYSLHNIETVHKPTSTEKKFEFNGKTVLTISTQIPKGNEIKIHQIDISKEYEDKKRLADYLITLMAVKRKK